MFKKHILLSYEFRSFTLAGVAHWTEHGLRTKGSQFDSQSEHMPGLPVRSPVRGVQEATTN